MRVSDSIAAAQYELVIEIPCKTQPRPEIVPIGINQCPIVKRAVSSPDDRVCRRVIVRKPILVLIIRRSEFVTEAKVECQILIHLEIILHLSVVKTAVKIDYKEIGELIL